jgi:hypothetical protein
LTVRVPAGTPTAALAKTVSRKWYEFPENDRGLQAVALDLGPASPALLVRTAAGETRTAIGVGSWARSRDGFANGLDHFLSVPAHPLVAASGAWTAPDTFTVKIAAYQTPFYSTLSLRFDGDRLLLDSEHNVAFGSTKVPPLVGQREKSGYAGGRGVGEIRVHTGQEHRVFYVARFEEGVYVLHAFESGRGRLRAGRLK